MEIQTLCQYDLDDLLAHDDTVDPAEYVVVEDESDCIVCQFFPKVTRPGWSITE